MSEINEDIPWNSLVRNSWIHVTSTWESIGNIIVRLRFLLETCLYYMYACKTWKPLESLHINLGTYCWNMTVRNWIIFVVAKTARVKLKTKKYHTVATASKANRKNVNLRVKIDTPNTHTHELHFPGFSRAHQWTLAGLN